MPSIYMYILDTLPYWLCEQYDHYGYDLKSYDGYRYGLYFHSGYTSRR